MTSQIRSHKRIFNTNLWYSAAFLHPNSYETSQVIPAKGFSPAKTRLKSYLLWWLMWCMYSQHLTLSTFSFISFFLTDNFSKARYSLFVLKVPLNHNQSIIRDTMLRRFHYVPLSLSLSRNRMAQYWTVWISTEENRRRSCCGVLVKCGSTPLHNICELHSLISLLSRTTNRLKVKNIAEFNCPTRLGCRVHQTGQQRVVNIIFTTVHSDNKANIDIIIWPVYSKTYPSVTKQ